MSSLCFSRAAIKGNVLFLRQGLRGLPFPLRREATFRREEGNEKTMSELRLKMIERLGLDAGYVPNPKPRTHLLQYEPKFEDLPPRSMQDSFSSAIIPLSRSKSLQDKYVATLGHVRFGRLMEDMDMFAVWVCHQHLNIPKLDASIPLPYTFVTILVDKIGFTDFTPKANLDIRISGHVSWVGRSSMEIVVWLEQLIDGEYMKITRALFLMAARNATNTKSAPVNPLMPANKKEEAIHAGGLKRKERRKQFEALSLMKVEPNVDEQKLIHELFIRTVDTDSMELNARVLPKNSRWMGDTLVVSTMASFPENRNAQYTVFGGFLMRNALEISAICCHLFCGVRAKLQLISDIMFQKPVNVSSFIKVNAYVVYTEGNCIQIMTLLDILDGATGKQMTSNIFSLTYKAPHEVAEVLPRTYDETLWYIDGRRKLRNAKTKTKDGIPE